MESSSPVPRRRSLAWRALAVWAAVGVGLGAGGPLGRSAAEAMGLGRTGRQLIAAVVMSVVVVGAVALLRRRVDRLPWAGLGLGTAPLRSFALGAAVTLGSAAAVIAPAVAAGWIELGPVEWPTLIGFLALNALIAFLLEAFPEELAFRGYLHATFRRRWGRVGSFAAATVLFALIMIPVSAVTWGVDALLGNRTRGLSLAPGGDDPVVYVVLLLCFGSTVLAARIATGSLWTAIAVHLTFLTVNRLVFANDGRDTGWEVAAVPDAMVLVLVYLATAVGVFALIGRRRAAARRPDRAGDAEPVSARRIG